MQADYPGGVTQGSPIYRPDLDQDGNGVACEPMDTDRMALVVLYNSTDGDNWVNNDNWLSDAPLNEWYGVTTDNNGRVTELNLGDNWLTGEIPADLGKLTNLQTLRLRKNGLAGDMPSETGRLINLQTLDLTENNLMGGIPPETGSLANLQLLWLSNNQLTGAIPAELGNLPNLKDINNHWC